MKRWGFKGGPRSHGSTKFHRKRGTIGSGRVRKDIFNPLKDNLLINSLIPKG